jgi:proline iminopeptidase
VRARGLEFAVYETPDVGDALPMLCINGGLLFDHRLLWPALSPLAARRRLVFFDQRGRGASQPPPGVRAARLEHDAGDVPAIRDALGIERWDVLGHSWGGGIAMLAVARDLEATRRLVLVDAVGPTGDWIPQLLPDALRRLEPLGAERHAALARFGEDDLTSEDPALQWEYSNALYPAWFADPALTALLSPPKAHSRTGAVVAARLRREGYDWRAPLRALRVPTLVIHGEEDLLPTNVARAIVATLPDARLELVAGAGHMPFWEAPDRFFALVERFLSQPA